MSSGDFCAKFSMRVSAVAAAAAAGRGERKERAINVFPLI